MPVANRLKQPLDRLCREFDWTRRVEQDAIKFPLRYTDPADIELAGLFASCMAYGRVDLFGAQVTLVLERMGESPARFVWGFDLEKHRKVFAGFGYRFNRERDVLAFCLAAQRIGVEDYKGLVAGKLRTAGELYQFLIEEFHQQRTFILELLVVVILVIELWDVLFRH